MNNEKTFTITLTASEFRALQEVLYYTLENEQAHFIETATEYNNDTPEFDESQEEAKYLIENTDTGHIYRDAYEADQAMLRNIPAYMEAVKSL